MRDGYVLERTHQVHQLQAAQQQFGKLREHLRITPGGGAMEEEWRIGEGDGAHQFRPMRRDIRRNEPTERMPVEHCRLPYPLFQETDDVSRELLADVAAVDVSGLAVSAKVQGEDAPALRQV